MTDKNREVSRLAKNKYARMRREAERQFENDRVAKAKSEPKLLHRHNRRKTTVKGKVIQLKNRRGDLTSQKNNKNVYEAFIKQFEEVFSVEMRKTRKLRGQDT